ncbi:MAG: hypothetical protein H0U76_29070 [Ktedonobacteraceae bacterium]|nr:hypothetical protein [Ktedonobacteraceae bacterium]
MFVKFEKGKKEDPIVRIGGKVSFAPKESGVKEGEWWEVEIAEERATVNWLRLIENFSAKREVTAYVKMGHNLYLFVDPGNHRRLICPEGFDIREAPAEFRAGQTWRFEIEPGSYRLIPVERLSWTEQEKNDRKRYEKALQIIEVLAPLRKGEGFHFITSESSSENIAVYHAYLPIHVWAELIHVEAFNIDHAHAFFQEHLETWRAGVVKAEKIRSEMRSDGGGHGEDHPLHWIGR